MNCLIEKFISIVIIAENGEQYVIDKLNQLYKYLKDTFSNYEVIVVDNKSADSTLTLLNDYSEGITIVELSRLHTTQMALTAGVDIAIGDYIVEIPSICDIEDWSLIEQLYNRTQEGFDFAFFSPQKTSFFSKVFYRILNCHFKLNREEEITSSVATISSRRAQNKVVSIGNRSVNRSVSYVLSGLNYTSIKGNIAYKSKRRVFENVSLFLDTLIFYTDILTRTMAFISIFFFCSSILFGLYSVFVKLFFSTAYGWASTVIILTIGFSGVFLMFAIIAKYLTHILNNTLETKTYIYRDIIKKNSEENR